MQIYAFHPDNFTEVSFTVLAETESEARVMVDTVLEAARGMWLREVEFDRQAHQPPIYGLTAQKIADYLVSGAITLDSAASPPRRDVEPSERMTPGPPLLGSARNSRDRRRPRHRAIAPSLR